MNRCRIGFGALVVVSLAVACAESGHADDGSAAKTPPPSEATEAKIPGDVPKQQRPELPRPFRGDPVESRTTASGLVISDYFVGDGPEVANGMDVALHYAGYLEDGRMFDSSRKRRRPYVFTVGQGKVIDGWDEGILGMKVGGKRVLEVPPELGYGARKAGKIPPNSRLFFTMELVAAYPPLPPPRGDDAFAGRPKSRRELDGGLVVEDFAEGTGEPADRGDTVVVHYTGKLEDGTVFDSSVDSGKAISFPLGVGKVIKGWDMGLAGMKVGGLRRLTVPAELGYGERALGKIPANANLTFTVELMAIR